MSTTPLTFTIDIALLTVRANELSIVLFKRDHEPFQGENALLSGYVHEQKDRDCQDTAARILKEKSGITPAYIEQLQTFSGAERDPRGWSASVAYIALASIEMVETSSQMNKAFSIFKIDTLDQLPFDQTAIVANAIARIRTKSQYSSLPCFLAGDTFSYPKLQKIYEICIGNKINKVHWRRKIDELDVLEAVEGKTEFTEAHRNAQVYRLKPECKSELKLLARGF